MEEDARLTRLEHRVKADPASVAFAALAEEYRRGGRYQEAVDVSRTGLVRHPAYLSARVTLGRALLELGKLEEARKEFEFVLRTAPENLAAIRGLAEIHHRGGQTSDSAESYQAALDAAEQGLTSASHQAFEHPDADSGLQDGRPAAAASAPAASAPAASVPAASVPAAAVPATPDPALAGLEQFLEADRGRASGRGNGGALTDEGGGPGRSRRANLAGPRPSGRRRPRRAARHAPPEPHLPHRLAGVGGLRAAHGAQPGARRGLPVRRGRPGRRRPARAGRRWRWPPAASTRRWPRACARPGAGSWASRRRICR